MVSIRHVLWLGFLCCFSLSAVGCDQIKDAVERKYYHGTAIGYQKCIDRNKVQGLNPELIANLCKEENQIAIYARFDGNARYNKEEKAITVPKPLPSTDSGFVPVAEVRYSFQGYIKNTSKDLITTRFTIGISHNENVDATGKVIVERHSFPAWIEPGAEFYFVVPEVKFCPSKTSKQDYEWGVTDASGLKIQLK